MAARLPQFFLQFTRVSLSQSVTSLSRTCLRTVSVSPVSRPVRDPDNECLLIKPGLKAKVIDGKKMAQRVRQEVTREVEKMVEGGRRPPQLTAVLVGDNPASHTYVSNKTRDAKKCQVDTRTILRDSSTSQKELLELVESLNRDDKVDGILVQLPLPSHIHERTICNAVIPEKDVDGFHTLNVGRYCSGEPTLIPATPLGVMEMLKRCRVPTFGKNICVVNRTKHIGFALAALLHSDGTGDATTTICHEHTPTDQLPVMTRTADIIIVGTGMKAWESLYRETGVPGLIRGDMVKKGAVVIDVGISRLSQPDGSTRLVGDVAFDEVSQVASLLTPVPGGVGPMTVAMVIRNTLLAAQKNYQFDFSSVR